jgi:hypothetical protein
MVHTYHDVAQPQVILGKRPASATRGLAALETKLLLRARRPDCGSGRDGRAELESEEMTASVPLAGVVDPAS